MFAEDSKGQSLKDTRISIVAKEKSLEAILSDIEKISGFHFVYRTDLVKPYQVKHYSANSLSVENVLSDLLHPRKLIFRQRGDNVLIETQNDTAKEEKKVSSVTQRPGAAITVTGRVEDEKGLPMPGVTVAVKGTQHSVATVSDGTYHIDAENGQTLIFSFLSYKTVEKVISGTQIINVRMEPESSQLNEVVVVGYGTQRRGDLTTAVSSLKAGEINNFTGTGVDKAMTGKMAGVQVLEPNGAPGAGITIAIRGKATVTAGTQPLYVIDGIPLSESNSNGPGLTVNPLNNINVADIETVDVLKDASAAAIYGSRGSNGVILITTKRGKKDKPTISYNGYAGYQKVLRKIDMLDAYEYAQLIYDAHNNAYFDLLADKGLSGSASDDNATRLAKLGGPVGATNQAYVLPPEIMPYLEGKPGLTNTDWQDAIFRQASTQNHTLSVAGGSDNIKYYVSGNYLNQQGVVIQSGFKRYGGRVNLDASYNKFKLGATINYGYEQYQFQPTEGRFASQEFIVPIALTAAPFFPVYNADGSYNYSQYNYQYATSQTINPVALANLKTDNTGQGKLLGNLFAQYDFTPELSNKLSFGVNINNANRNTFRPSVLPTVNPSSLTSIPTGSYRNISLLNWLVENTLTYNKQFGNHNINAVAAVSAQKETFANSVINATGYANDMVTTLNGATSIQSFGGGTEQWTLLSALTRVQYSFKDKYLASAAIRADGSSRFGANSKYGYFPSASLGWNVDREDFMQAVKAVSSLKLRASYGLTGNMQIGNYAYLSLLSPSNYVFGPNGSTKLANGSYQSTAGNDELGWERTSAFNIGADIGFLRERLHLTVDAYTNNTSDLLLQVPVAHTSGYRDNLQNIGKVRNQGLEFTLSGDNKIGEFRVTNSANISFNRNKVLDLGGARSMITQAQGVIYFITEVGKPIGNYYTLVQDGIYKSQAELNDPNIPKVPGAKVGDMKFKDINGDKVIDPTNDRSITGNYMPKFTYGFSSQLQYKLFDLSVALQGVYGNKIANINSRYINSLESFTNNTAEALDRFHSEADPGSGNYPRANRSQRGLNANMSTYSIRSGSYLRIRDITFGVTLPNKLATKAGIGKARLYFTATNPFMFTKYNAYNPEISQESNPLMPGVDYGSYPLSKSFVFGLNLSF
ncbi:TonB-dependent receptor [Mucilaginibacter limnophilus]|uniref:TonB-dependent receptor n=2 Tax=Mucilaginibacter limnophilus TaxID=1932778 RepID=A0A437MWR2_9SPHI|nr:TonB-dependent receptor [Mucilaginibacter limnophilus]